MKRDFKDQGRKRQLKKRSELAEHREYPIDKSKTTERWPC
jgi:hypothetical protein